MRQAIVSLVSFLLITNALTSSAETLEVEVFQAQQQPHHLTLELSGNVVPEHDSQLASLEAGIVTAIFVEAGDKVVVGQKLLSLDNTLAKLRLSQEQADHSSALVQQQEAQRQYDEVISLSESKLVADSLIAELKAALASAQSRLSNAQARVALQKEIVKRHILTAPFDGVIAKRKVNLGEWIGQQSQVFQLVSDQKLRLIVELPQEHLKAISKKPKVMALVIPDVMPDMQYELAITSIVPVSEPTSRTLQIRINLPTNTAMIAGMSARARLNLSDDTDSNTATLSWIPRTALKQHPDGSNSVFTVHLDTDHADPDNKNKPGRAKVKRRKIKLIKSDMDRVAVTGLAVNSIVVVSATELLKDNQSVNTVATKDRQDKGSR
jgi:RND family efflux transporter MFP subunit